jgi:hypothetical protein
VHSSVWFSLDRSLDEDHARLSSARREGDGMQFSWPRMREVLWRRGPATCPGCGAPMRRRSLACPDGCGFDRRNEVGASGSGWERLDRY